MGMAPFAATDADNVASMPARNVGSYGNIPGSSPEWRGTNFKSKGKSPVPHVPPSQLGATGWESWTFFQEPCPGFGRRHYHHSALAQTVAKASLPCVDPASMQAATSADLQLSSSSLAAAYQEQRRHRRMIATPPEQHRPQGKRMIAKPLPESQELLKDPAPAFTSSSSSSSSSSKSKSKAAAAAHTTGSCDLQGETTSCSSSAHVLQPSFAHHAAEGSAAFEVQQPAPAAAAMQVSSDGSKGRSTGSSCYGGGKGSSFCSAPESAAVPAAGDLESGRTGVPPRVEDNPDYFRTLKDPPAFQRFCTSIKPPATKPGELSTAARHELGLKKQQLAAAEQARKDVATLHMADL